MFLPGKHTGKVLLNLWKLTGKFELHIYRLLDEGIYIAMTKVERLATEWVNDNKRRNNAQIMTYM